MKRTEFLPETFEPDYATKCIECGQSPCVVVKRGTEVLVATERCGPCTFGSAECIDPKNW